MPLTNTAATIAVDSLRSHLSCPVVTAADKEYDLLRSVWNSDIDRHPLAIVRCRNAEDVAAALTWCVSNGHEVTVRGGGHNIAGTAVQDGAVMIDTGALNEVTFDRAAGTVNVGAGCRLGDMDRACADQGVVVPAGTVSHTGVAGLTLGGGAGYLARMYGLTVDHLVEVEIVVADGRILVANAEEHPELFWALRGAGHNFGIATRFTYTFIPFTMTANIRQAVFRTSDRMSVLQAFRDWAYEAPDTITAYARTVKVPPYWTVVPSEHRDTDVVYMATVHWGDPADEPGESAPAFAGAKPVWEHSYSTRHVDLQHASDDDFRYGLRRYWRNGMLNEFPDDAIATVLDWSDRYPGRPLQASATVAPHFDCPFQIYPRGGAASRVDFWDSAVGDRVGPKWMSTVASCWEFPSEAAELVDWSRGFDESMSPYRNGTYINFTSVVGDEVTARYVYGDKYERLVAVKKEYDPDNVFHRGLADLSGTSDRADDDAS
ncbi:MAG: FAD-binding oxidoreductase [Nocardioidaceae bacterium]|nr:FAD-binding oxidoreductase [Nocardioidaceae bacterium]